MLHRILREMTRTRRREQSEDLRGDLHRALSDAGKPASLLEEFDALESPWTAPERTGFEPAASA
jgi:hypothetical protein